MKLTVKQKMLLEAIEWYIAKYGYSPTQKELAQMLKCGTRPIFEKLMVLEAKGYIKTENSKARTIKVLRGEDHADSV